MTAKKKPAVHQKFWYVSRSPEEVPYHDPKKAHYSLAAAKSFAAQLCKDTGHRFFVMEAIEMVEPQVPPLAWTELA